MGKHILNSPKTAILDSLSGLAFLNPATEVYDTTLLLRSPSHDRVHIVCGGGGGHEPAHAAFVGEGMLSAAVSGQVFASPNAGQVEKAIGKLSMSKGVLLVVKNYTGDVLQFGLAKERWSATHLEEDSVRMVVVGDDVSVPRSQGALTGRRGLTGTVLVYKLAGALAAQGASLDEVEFVAKSVAERCGTIGMGLEHCHVPGTEKGEAYLKDDEAEIGMGIHNEPGIRKVSPIPTASKLVDEFLTTLTSTNSDPERSYLPFKNDGQDEVILVVNNLGGLPELELGVVVKEAAEWLANKRITVRRAVSGAFMTSLNLPGFSLTLLLLPRTSLTPPPSTSSHFSLDTPLLLDLFDAPTQAPAWKWTFKGEPEMRVLKEGEVEKVGKREEKVGEEVKGPKPTDPKLFLAALESALKSVISAEPEITRYDTIAGDGDAGLTLKAGAEGIMDAISQNKIPSDDVVAAMVACSAVVEKEMGGTSGGLYAIGLSGLSKGMLDAAKEKGSETATPEVWARGLELALNTLYRYTRARPPSRTLVDPLSSFILTFSSSPTSPTALSHAIAAAHEAAEATRDLDAKAGRAAYVDQEKIREAGAPDAGAWGVWKLLEGVQKAVDHWDADHLAGWQEDLLSASYRGRVFEIVKLGGEVIGTLRVSAFHKEDSWEDYGGFHDEMRGRNEGADKAELDAFSKLFTKKGYFKREVSSGGLGTFGREVTNEPYLVLLDTVRVKPEYREKGVGTWAVKKLFELGEEDFLFYDEAKEKKKAEEEDERKAKAPQGTPGLDSYYGSGFLESLFKKRARRNIKFLFVRPRSLESQLSQNPDSTHTLADLRKAAEKTSKERIGFRRVGETSFLCMASDPNHFSRLIPIDRDARDMDDPDVKRNFMAAALRSMSNVQLPDVDYDALWGDGRASKKRKT
ncbi:Dihydroxyacetone kinase 2 [Rhodotorula toruloides]|nr:Dihydroxyacetone kinase 2 [Rhodotorula toruloides]